MALNKEERTQVNAQFSSKEKFMYLDSHRKILLTFYHYLEY